MKKPIFTLFGLLFSLFILQAQTGNWQDTGNVAIAFDGGNGETEATAFEIATPQQLAWLAKSTELSDFYKDKYFKLTTDIDLGAHFWTPIGAFLGEFDGNGHTIANMNIKGDYHAAGLWSDIGPFTTIKNLGIIDCTIDISYKTQVGSVGALVGHVISGIGRPVTNCYSSGVINVSAPTADLGSGAIGGLIGSLTTSSALPHILTALYSSVDITVHLPFPKNESSKNGFCIGGLAGIWDGDIISSYSTGNITVVTDDDVANKGKLSIIAGGIVGSSLKTQLNACYATGDITFNSNINDTNSRVDFISGGLSGSLGMLSTLRNSYSSGNIISNTSKITNNNIGGLAANTHTITNCMAANTMIKVFEDFGEEFSGIIPIRRIIADTTAYMEYPAELLNNYALQSMNIYVNDQLQSIDGSNPNGLNGLDKTQEQLYQRATYETGLNWNFTKEDVTKWIIEEGKSYPTLAWDHEPLFIILQPEGDSIKLGGAHTLSVVTKGRNLNYQWYLENKKIEGATSSSYTISDIQKKDQGCYHVEISNKDGKKTSLPAELSVLAPIEVKEVKPIGSNNKGGFNIAFSFPANTIFTNTNFNGSLRLIFPDGIELDEGQTGLEEFFTDNVDLKIKYEKERTWLLEFSSSELKSDILYSGSPNDVVYTRTVSVGYQVYENMAKGNYTILIQDVDLKLSDHSTILEVELPVTITVERHPLGISEVNNSTVRVFIKNEALTVNSPVKEAIDIYSVSGVKLYSAKKQAGVILIPLTSSFRQVFIVKGSSGWTRKVVQ